MASSEPILCSPATCEDFLKRLFLTGRGRNALAQFWAGKQTIEAMSDMYNAFAIFGPIPHEQILDRAAEHDLEAAAQWFDTSIVASEDLATHVSGVAVGSDPRIMLAEVVAPFARQIALRCFRHCHGHKSDWRRIVEDGFMIDALPRVPDPEARIQEWTELFIFGGALSMRDGELTVTPLQYRSWKVSLEKLRDVLGGDGSEHLPFVDQLKSAVDRPGVWQGGYFVPLEYTHAYNESLADSSLLSKEEDARGRAKL